jgi:hypothetical protein
MLALFALLTSQPVRAFCDANSPEIRRLNALANQSNAILERSSGLAICSAAKLELVKQRLAVMQRMVDLGDQLSSGCASDNVNIEAQRDNMELVETMEKYLDACARNSTRTDRSLNSQPPLAPPTPGRSEMPQRPKLEPERLFLVVSSGFHATTVAELIAYAKSNPRRVTIAITNHSGSNEASATRSAAELFVKTTGLDLTAYSYDAYEASVRDVIGGSTMTGFFPTAAIAEGIKTGTLRILAVTGSQRLTGFANVPTLAESF